MSPAAAQTLLFVAGLACCVAMSMPQVHIVAYCGDLGYGPARGAQMLSLMLGFGIVSRLVSGWICDHIGGLRTLLLGSGAAGRGARCSSCPSTASPSLYVVSALFGLFQGGIVPAYAIIVREYFSPEEAGARVGTVLMATLFGMALGGWMSGRIFDLTGSYDAAFLNGIAWNLLNLTIAYTLLRRVQLRRGRRSLGQRVAGTVTLAGKRWRRPARPDRLLPLSFTQPTAAMPRERTFSRRPSTGAVGGGFNRSLQHRA